MYTAKSHIEGVSPCRPRMPNVELGWTPCMHSSLLILEPNRISQANRKQAPKDRFRESLKSASKSVTPDCCNPRISLGLCTSTLYGSPSGAAGLRRPKRPRPDPKPRTRSARATAQPAAVEPNQSAAGSWLLGRSRRCPDRSDPGCRSPRPTPFRCRGVRSAPASS